MKRSIVLGMVGLVAVLSLAVALPASAQGPEQITARIRGFEEVPTLSTFGGGQFEGTINEDRTEISFTLSYLALNTPVLQAHIHIGQRATNGGIMVFLCSNLPNPPAGTQPCPASPGEVSGTLTADDVGNLAASQGVTAGQFSEVVRAIRAGFAYVNVHTEQYPGGELRGQLRALGPQ